ncbi:hypothetical protein ZHAS_00017542 [Anopheles sinensis]|uniref:Uncharacterized protein n=1 Tax=Anopheles sinensis TaxID=74873 RepID=A0A084WGU4_ANOSI|nr:hypothetical protein ZHAS_00017542 [Anopheles sinensis]
MFLQLIKPTDDRHIRADSDGEPLVDPSQDYRMQFGFVNQTHTVFRFKRNLDTCDMKDDFPITIEERLETWEETTDNSIACSWNDKIEQPLGAIQI